MCSIDSGLWCWDATTLAASDDAPSQRRGWRGVLSFSFEVRMRQGRVTLPCKSLRGVRAPNTDPSPSSSESPPPPPGAPALLHRGGGGGLPPPTPEASGVESDTLPFPFTCPNNCSTRALSTAISPSWAAQDSCCRCSSSGTRLILIS